MKLAIAGMAAVLSLAAGHARATGDDIAVIDFESENGELTITACDASLLGCREVSQGQDVIWGQRHTHRPPGATTQVLEFLFYADDYFAESSGHFAIAVNGTEEYDQRLTGRGVLIGDVTGTVNGCSVAAAVEIEVFGEFGNHLYPETCRPLRDGWIYEMRIEGDVETGIIRYEVEDIFGFVHYTAETTTDECPSDPEADCYVPPGTGWWFAHVFNTPGSNWSVTIVDIESSWY